MTFWLPGELAADRPLDASAARPLGRALAEVHRPAPDDAPFNSEQSVRLAEREQVLRTVLPQLPAVGASRGLTLDLDAAATVWRQALAAPDDAPRVWIHADLHSFNVISLNGQFGDIIDWSDISYGDPAVDLGFLHLLLPAAAMPMAYDGYGGVDEATAARARGISLIKAATLAVVDKEVVANVGWQALVELGVAQRSRATTTPRYPRGVVTESREPKRKVGREPGPRTRARGGRPAPRVDACVGGVLEEGLGRCASPA